MFGNVGGGTGVALPQVFPSGGAKINCVFCDVPSRRLWLVYMTPRTVSVPYVLLFPETVLPVESGRLLSMVSSALFIVLFVMVLMPGIEVEFMH